MSVSVAQMRDLLALGEEVPAAQVADAYASWLDGEPAVELLSLEEVKQHLKVVTDEEDALITGYVAAAIGHLDGEDGWLGRSITRQTHTLRLSCLSRSRIRLPYPPVVSVTSVTHHDGSEAFATVDPASYELVGRHLQPKFGQSWPIVSPASGAVLITYAAGYTVLPPALRAALLLMIGDLYAARETFVLGSAAAVPMSTTVEALLSPLRVFT
jgi:uncharacterized phiE125 gp8 family phage protein